MSVNHGFGENCQKCEIWSRGEYCDVVLRVLFFYSLGIEYKNCIILFLI